MSETLGRAVLIISTDSKQFEAGVAKGKRSAQSLATRFRKVGREITTTFGLPLAALGAHILKTAANFESGMNRVQALTSATGDEFKALEEQARQLGGTTQFSASQAADAMGFLAQAGASANEILAQMPATLNLAAAGQIELAQSADILTNIMKGYGRGVEETTRTTDILTATFTGSNTNLVQLGEAMKLAGPVASGFGIKFEEAAAFVGLMGNAGFQATLAGTALRGALVRLATPTTQNATLMRELGINVFDAKGNMVSLVEIMKQLETSGARTEEIMEIFGQRAGPAMVAVLKQGSGALVNFTKVVVESGDRAKEVADVQMKGLTGELRNLKSAFEELELTVANSGMLSLVTDWVEGFSCVLRELTNGFEQQRLLWLKAEIRAAKRNESRLKFLGITIDLSSKLEAQYKALLIATFKLVGVTKTIANDYAVLGVRTKETAEAIKKVTERTKETAEATREFIRTGVGALTDAVEEAERGLNDMNRALEETDFVARRAALAMADVEFEVSKAAMAVPRITDALSDTEQAFAGLVNAGLRAMGQLGMAFANFADTLISEFERAFTTAANIAIEAGKSASQATAAGNVAGLAAAATASGPAAAVAAGQLVFSLLMQNERFAAAVDGLNETLAKLLAPIAEAIAPSLEALIPLLVELQPVFEHIGKMLALYLKPLVIQIKLLTGILKHVDEALKALVGPLETLGKIIEAFNPFGGGGIGGTILGAFGFHGGSGGPLHANDLARLPGMAPNEGLALLQAGETVLPARSQVTIQLNGDDSTTYSKRQIRSLLSAIREEISDDSTFPLLQVVG